MLAVGGGLYSGRLDAGARETMLKWQSIVEKDFGEGVEPAYRGGRHALSLPDAKLRATSSIADLGPFYAIGEAWAHVVHFHLAGASHVLDVGCSCGKLARFLYLNPLIQYTGLDVDRKAVDWCKREFDHLAGDRFTFRHADVHSALYNPLSDTAASEYHFPVDDASVDMVVAASLFTHLLQSDAEHYLEEICRVLGPEGTALISIHIDVSPGEVFQGDETRIDVEPTFFMNLAAGAGLEPKKIVGRVYGAGIAAFWQGLISLFGRCGRQANAYCVWGSNDADEDPELNC